MIARSDRNLICAWHIVSSAIIKIACMGMAVPRVIVNIMEEKLAQGLQPERICRRIVDVVVAGLACSQPQANRGKVCFSTQ